jgi:hypothetical protein
MVIHIKLEPAILWACALGISAGILLFPVIWNKKEATSHFRPPMDTNQGVKKKTSEQ